MTYGALPVGYGRQEVEPGIAPLVEAVRAAGFDTFSSCEGHLARESPDDPYRLGSVGFYADEQRAKKVHVGLIRLRPRLACSWILQAGFVHPRGATDWRLGWTLENWGNTADGPTESFVARTIETGRKQDMPLLIELFGALNLTT